MMRLLIIVIFVFFHANLFAQFNDGFESGLKDWVTKGVVKNESTHQRSGGSCIEMNKGGNISRKVPASGLAVVQFTFFARSTSETIIYFSVSFYNSADHLLMKFDSKQQCDTNCKSTGNYVESPFETAYMIIGIQRDSSDIAIYVDDFSVESTHAFDAVQPEPLINIDEYMRPFWKTDTIVNETVLLYAEKGQPATGKLFYQPSKILSVKSFDLQSEYKLNTDYIIQKNILTAIRGSSITVVADTFFKRENLAWYDIQSKWVVVTYLRKEKWNAAVPAYKGASMPLIIAKLKAKKPVVIASYGMSITKGMDVSGFDSVAPYMPNYADLFAHQLRRSYNYIDVRNYNAALPGATAEWGANFAADYINPIKADLVVLDFGMNDFWRYTPAEFRAYLDTMMRKIRIGNSHAEFLLISNMSFDPDYILNSDTNKITYLKNFNGYLSVMKEMQKKGVVCFDMTTLSANIYKMKKAKDCIANPLHPNDYLARWYAQGMSALFISNY